MSHLVETMAYAGETPWHGLGKEVPADLSPEQMLVAAGLDWTVEKIPAFATVNGKRVNVGHSALVRSSDQTILDVVTNDWNPVQNSEAFDFFNEFVHAGDMEMHTAGSLRDGQIVWALAKVKDSFTVFKDDKVDAYLLFTNPHRFGQSIDIRFTPIRVVCNNTITLALNQHAKRVVKASHRTEFDPHAAKTALGIAHHKLGQYKEMAVFLGSKPFNERTLKDYFKEVFPVASIKKNEPEIIQATSGNVEVAIKKEVREMSRNAETALSVIDSQPGAEFAKGSWWQAFNTVTFMVDHKLGRTDETRLNSAWFGQGNRVKVNALEKAVEYAKAA